MPSKSYSALQRVTQTLRGYLKNSSGKTLLERSPDAFGVSFKYLNNVAWPEREESFAAAQLLRQTRNWNDFRKFGTFGTQSYLANKKKYLSRHDLLLSQKDVDRLISSSADEQNKKSPDDPADAEQDEEMNIVKASFDNNDDRLKIGTVQEMIFGKPEKDDYHANQLKADNELLSQVVKHRNVFSEFPISRKVIAPYTTYDTHRNNWAEFRHRMIYGGRRY